MADEPEPIAIDTARRRFAARALGRPGDPAVICLHGFPDDAGTIDGLLPRLAASGFRAVAPYLRGYAPSPLEGPYGMGATSRRTSSPSRTP
jgi:pimeloyl-ACP methyl ester carboxylesterase